MGIAGVTRDRECFETHKACIWGVYVAPEHRGAGVGKQIISYALDCARVMPRLVQLKLFVTAENFSAIRLYEGMGFKCYGIEPDAILMDGVFYDVLFMICRIPGHPASASLNGCVK